MNPSNPLNPLIQLFKKSRSIGIVGNPNTAKSSLVLNYLVDLRQNKPNIPIFVLGAEKSLHKYLSAQGIDILYSTDDILDMHIKNAVIYIDEFSDLFDVRMASKQTHRIKRFFNRIVHLNNYVIISSAEVNFWNKFMCGLVQSFLIKSIDYLNLVRGTHLKRRIMNIAENTSEYRLEIPAKEYYIMTNEDVLGKASFAYSSDLDPKKDMVNPFLELELNPEISEELKLDDLK